MTEPHAALAVARAAAEAALSAGSGSVSAAPNFSWGGYFQAIGIMLLLLAALWAAVWAVRRYGKFNFIPAPGALPRDALRVEAQLPLGPRRGLVVVRFLNTRLLLGVTDQQITVLKETGLHDHEDAEQRPFQELLEAAETRGNNLS